MPKNIDLKVPVVINSTMDNYINEANRTSSSDINAITNRFSTQRDVTLLHAAMGAVTESAELLDAVKKYLFYGKPVDLVNVEEEAGDLMWYLALLFKEMGWTFERVGARNIAKLAARYPDKFRSDLALNRDLDAERAILESNDILPAPEPVPTIAVVDTGGDEDLPDLSARATFPAKNRMPVFHHRV